MTSQFIIFGWSVMAINHFPRKNFITFLTLFQGYRISGGKIIRSGLSEGHHISSTIPAFTWHSISLQVPFQVHKPFSFTLRRPLTLYQTDREGEGRRGSRRMNQRGTAELSVLHWSSSHKDCGDHLWLPLSPSPSSRHDSEFTLFFSLFAAAPRRAAFYPFALSRMLFQVQPLCLIVQF